MNRLSKLNKIYFISGFIGFVIIGLIFFLQFRTNSLASYTPNVNKINNNYIEYYKYKNINEYPKQFIDKLVKEKDPLFFKCLQGGSVDFLRLILDSFEIQSECLYLDKSLHGIEGKVRQQITKIRKENNELNNIDYIKYLRTPLYYKYRKEIILEYYINYLEFENNIYGYEMLSQAKFRKNISDLNEKELGELIKQDDVVTLEKLYK